MKLRVWRLTLPLFFATTLACIGLASLVGSQSTDSADHTILVWINQHGNNVIDQLCKAITVLGEPTLVAGFMIMLAIWLYRKGHGDRSALTGVALIGSTAIMLLLKHAFHRGRPDIWQPLVHESSFSFPSAHAMASITLALTLIYVLHGYRQHNIIIAVAAMYTVLIGFSRLYLGVHYPSDVLGGWLAAAAWVLLLISLHSGSKRYTV